MNDSTHSLVADFFAHYPTRSYPKNQIIIFNGEIPDNIYYIVSGKVCMYDITYRGDEIITNIYKHPAFFPMSLALNGALNPFFYKAEADTVVHYAPAQDVIAFLLRNPKALLDLVGRLYSGMDGLMGRIVQLMSGNAQTRLIYELVVECKRFGKAIGDNRYLLDVHERHIASRSGLSRETVSRGMKRLKQAGLIAIEPAGIIVNDITGLSALPIPAGT